MTKFICVTLLIGISLVARAQQIPNSGFENWHFPGGGWNETPDYYINVPSWDFNTTKSTDAHSGTYSIRLKSTLTTGDTSVSIIGSGNCDAMGNCTFGTPFADKPAALRFWIKGYVANGDSARTIVHTFSFDDTLGQFVSTAWSIHHATGNYGSWTQIEVPFQYASFDVHDSIMVNVITTTNEYQIPAGSTDILIDDFELVYGVTCDTLYGTTYESSTNEFIMELDTSTLNGVQYLWDFGDGTTSTDQYPTHVYSNDTLYNVCLAVTHVPGPVCSYCHVIGFDDLGNVVTRTDAGFTLQVVPSTNSVNAVLNDIEFEVYPNPTNGSLSIISHIGSNDRTFIITDLMGRVLEQIAGSSNETTFTIENPGVYILTVKTPDGDLTWRTKVLVQ